jgi:hypothetical protein
VENGRRYLLLVSSRSMHKLVAGESTFLSYVHRFVASKYSAFNNLAVLRMLQDYPLVSSLSAFTNIPLHSALVSKPPSPELAFVKFLVECKEGGALKREADRTRPTLYQHQNSVPSDGIIESLATDGLENGAVLSAGALMSLVQRWMAHEQKKKDVYVKLKAALTQYNGDAAFKFYKLVGGSTPVDCIELDRDAMTHWLQEHGVSCVDTWRSAWWKFHAGTQSALQTKLVTYRANPLPHGTHLWL